MAFERDVKAYHCIFQITHFCTGCGKKLERDTTGMRGIAGLSIANGQISATVAVAWCEPCYEKIDPHSEAMKEKPV